MSATFALRQPVGARNLDAGPDLIGRAHLGAGSVDVAGLSVSRSAPASDGTVLWLSGVITGSRNSPDHLVEMFRRGGVEAFGSLQGLAVIVVWDAVQRTIHLSRHPGGASMIYYRVDRDTVEFSTRILDMVQPSDTVNWRAATQFLRSGAILGQQSMVSQIHRVPAHEAMSISVHGRRATPIWTPSLGPKDLSPSTSERVEALDELVRNAIEHWLSTVQAEPAILMSGGIDSVGLAAAMRRIDPDLPLTAYTLRFRDPVGQIDEFDEAAAVADAIGIRHEPIWFEHEFITNHLEWMMAEFGEPFGYAIHTSLLSPIAERGHQTVFAGTGPDAYYPEGSQNRWESASKIIPDSFHSVIARLATSFGDFKGARGARKAFEIKSTPVAERLAITAGPVNGPEKLIKIGISGEQIDSAVRAGSDYFAPRLERLRTTDRSIQSAYGWSYAVFPDQGAGWMKKWTSAYRLQVAMPLHEPAIAEYLMRMSRLLPDRGEFRELALRSISRPLAYNRKVGQSVPLALWFRGPLRELAYERLLDEDSFDGLLARDGLEEMLAEHMAGAANHQWLIWQLVALSAWKSVFDSRRG